MICIVNTRVNQCDEQKPSCQACLRLGLQCEGYQQRFTFRNALGKPQRRKVPEAVQTNPQQTPISSIPDDTHPVRTYLTPHNSDGCEAAPTEPNPGSTETIISPASGTESLGLNISSPSDTRRYLSPFGQNFIQKDSEFYPGNSLAYSGSSDHAELESEHDTTSFPGILISSPESSRNHHEPLETSQPVLGQTSDSHETRRAEYLALWNEKGLPGLESIARITRDLASHYRPVESMVCALTAQISVQSGRPHGHGRRSQIDDEMAAFSYYHHALQAFSVDVQHGSNYLDMCPQLLVLLLFTIFEFNFGTILGGIYHLKRMDQIMDGRFSQITTSDTGVRLAIAWSSIRAHAEAMCCPYHSGSFARRFQKTAIEQNVERLVSLTSSSSEFLAIRLSQCLRCHRLLLLHTIVGTDMTSHLYRRWVSLTTNNSFDKPPSSLLSQGSTQELLDSLSRQRVLLDEWHTGIPLQDRPIDGLSSKDTMGPTSAQKGLHIRPLQFISFEAAMNYARYCCAQLLASGSASQSCVTSNSSAELNPWVLLFLRILAGISLEECIEKNALRMGILFLIQEMAYLCFSLKALIWLDLWVSGTEKHCGDQEGGLPVRLISRVLKRLIQETENGRTLLLLTSDLPGSHEKRDLTRHPDQVFKAIAHGMDDKRSGLEQSSYTDRFFVEIIELI